MNTRETPIVARSLAVRLSTPKLLCVLFNHSMDCFAVGHDTGFRVYNTDPMSLQVKRTFNKKKSNSAVGANSGIGKIAMLHRTNFLALVGGGKSPKFPVNKVIIYDDFKKKNTLSLEFMSPILNLRLTRCHIIVVLRNTVYVYAFTSPPKLVGVYEMVGDDFGIVDIATKLVMNKKDSNKSATDSITDRAANGFHLPINDHGSSKNITKNSHTTSSSSDSVGGPIASSNNLGNGSTSLISEILAFPARQQGHIHIIHLSPASPHSSNTVATSSSNLTISNSPPAQIIKAHKAPLRCIALNKEGTLIALSSITGTIIRVFSVSNGTLLFEFRRGLDKADVYTMKFSPNSTKLAVLSDKETLHIFSLSSNYDDKNQEIIDLGENNEAQPDFDGSSNSFKEYVDENGNREHKFRNLPIFGNYFKSKWSFVSCHLNDLEDSSAIFLSNSKRNSNNTNNDSTDYTKYNDSMNYNKKIIDHGEIGWVSESSLVIIWKFRGKWEKYVIIKNNDLRKNRVEDSGGSKYSLVRESWKSFGSLDS